MSKGLLVICCCMFLLISAAAYAADHDKNVTADLEQRDPQEDTKPFYDQWDKPGWWWGHYQSEDEPKEKKKDRKDDKAPFIPPPLSAYKYEKLWNMHPDAFQALLMDYQKKAVMNPSEDNVHDYYVMQDIARKKSVEFTNVAMMVWQKNPELNVLKDYPVSPVGITSRVRQQNGDIESKIHNNADNFALVYFYSSSCDYCAQQTNILKMFVDKYDWQVKKVEINESPDLAARFNAETVPMIIMIHRNSEHYMPVTSGLAALNEIEENLYRGIRLLSGEITPEQFSQYGFQDHSTFNPQQTQDKGHGE